VAVWACCSTAARGLEAISKRRVWSVPLLFAVLSDIKPTAPPTTPLAVSVGGTSARRTAVREHLETLGVPVVMREVLFDTVEFQELVASTTIFFSPTLYVPMPRAAWEMSLRSHCLGPCAGVLQPSYTNQVSE
jgi:hypothetical protein